MTVQLGIVEGLKGDDRGHIAIVRPDTASSPPPVTVTFPLGLGRGRQESAFVFAYTCAL